MTTLIIGLTLFIGAHTISIVNVAWRDGVVGRIGKGPWQGLYSLVALAGFVLIIYGYGLARQDPVFLYVPPMWLRTIALVLMIPVFVLFLAPYFPGRIKTTVRHPMLVATKIWALSHLFANGTLADVVLFGSFIAWAGMDRMSMKRREPRAVPGAPSSKWNDLIALILGLAIYAVFIGGAHLWLIGVPVGSPWG
jgi:uncharacterized membrane protein